MVLLLCASAAQESVTIIAMCNLIYTIRLLSTLFYDQFKTYLNFITKMLCKVTISFICSHQK